MTNRVADFISDVKNISKLKIRTKNGFAVRSQVKYE